MIALLEGDDPEGEPYKTELVSEDESELVARVIERKTGTAQTYRLPRAMFATPEYAGFVKIHKELEALAGTPPFTGRAGQARGRGAVVRGAAHARCSRSHATACRCSASRASAR